MHFPVSGVECAVWVPPLVAFAIAVLTAPAGLSGAFLLLPFQTSVLGFTSPAVTPTNLIYNIVAVPGGVYRYVREGRMAWPLTWSVIGGTVPGVCFGAVVRVRYMPDPRTFKLFVGVVLLYLGGRLLYDFFSSHSQGGRQRPLQLPLGAVVKTRSISTRKIEFEFRGKTFSFSPAGVVAVSSLVGLVGGIYGVGGGAIIAPYAVTILEMPAYTVAGASLLATLITSVAGVAAFELLGFTALGAGAPVHPDWALGALFGAGGLAGTYLGARLQKHLPEQWIRLLLGLLITVLALGYTLRSLG